MTRTRAYPRAGGGTWNSVAFFFELAAGLSPRGRGNPVGEHRPELDLGPIPARAGEPGRLLGGRPRHGAYPRAGGGTARVPSHSDFWWGLSPRGRGNLGVAVDDAPDRGPIPARAGEPSASRAGRMICGAYPRAGGGTSLRPSAAMYCAGLSPRGRGNPVESVSGDLPRGPIPARAGEPGRAQTLPSVERAYPRAGGGTSFNDWSRIAQRGLSPRGRGNLRAGRDQSTPNGPIPARAGEPCSSSRCTTRTRAYPRAGGGTIGEKGLAEDYQGLSPRGRGNLPGGHGRDVARGPIPARAGEPCHPLRRATGTRAYPRAGGGTPSSPSVAICRAGLSPRGRGNPDELRPCRQWNGPIPARAGEPTSGSWRGSPRWAYPRAGGGTTPFAAHVRVSAGLSPRGRGNLGVRLQRSLPDGPIPARAGEPR